MLSFLQPDSIKVIRSDQFGNSARYANDTGSTRDERDHLMRPVAGAQHTAWVALHATAAKFLSDTQSSLDATAVALNKAVEMYAATDQAAATEFKRLCDVNGLPHVGG